MFAEINNNRFWLSDFEVYYKAAERIFSGNNLYKITEDGHYVFKYSPTSALYFLPFIIFPFYVAKIIYWVFLSFVVIAGFWLTARVINPSLFSQESKLRLNLFFLSAIFILALHFLRELHLGQVNYILLFLFILFIYFLGKKNVFLASFILAFSVFIKPFGLIFLPYFLVKNQIKSIFFSFGFIILLALLPFLFFGSIETTFGQYQLWIDELRIELSNKQGLLKEANHTIFSVFARYTPLRYVLDDKFFAALYQLFFLCSIGFFFLWFILSNKKRDQIKEEKQNLIFETSLLVSFVPLLAFTSENAFVFTQLVIFIVLIYFRVLKPWEKICAVAGFIFIGGNFSELVGKEFSRILDELSLISIGAILLIYLVVVLRQRIASQNHAH